MERQVDLRIFYYTSDYEFINEETMQKDLCRTAISLPYGLHDSITNQLNSTHEYATSLHRIFQNGPFFYAFSGLNQSGYKTKQTPFL